MTTSTTTGKAYWFAILGLLVGWQLLSLRVGQSIIIPPLGMIGREFWAILTSAASWGVIAATLLRVAGTFLLDLVLALLLGIPAGIFPTFEQVIRPAESTMRTIPTMGVVLLALIWLNSELTPIFVTSLILFPILYRSVVDGVRAIDEELVEFHRVHHVPFRKQLRHFYIPSMVIPVKTGAVNSLGLGFKVMITAEVLSQPSRAIGTVFQVERAQLNTAAVLAWCVFMIIVSSLFELLIGKAGKTEAVLEVAENGH